MKCFGVAAEFNPFHDGHSYLIEKAKETTGCQCCIAAMSGDFTQRGEPAVFDKWERAKAAVEHGADLVLEIPQVFACSSASYFAEGAVRVLAGLGVCDNIVFGSECGDIDSLRTVSGFISEHADEIDNMAADLIKQGISYPKAREQAIDMLSEGSGISSFVSGPNDVLAVEYLRQDLGGMKPAAIKRTGKGHFETASEIRQELEKKYREDFDRREELFFDLTAYRIAVTPADELDQFAESDNGLGSKVKKELRYAEDLTSLIERVKSKAYTRTAVTRLLTHILLGIRPSDMTAASYARVLAMNETGAEALRTAKKEELSTIPVISNLTKDMEKLNDLQKRMISFDITAGDVYNIVTGKNLYANSDHVKSPFKA